MKLPNCLPKWLYFCTPTSKESFCCSMTSLQFGVVGGQDFGHNSRCVMVSHCCFNLCFLDDIGCGAFFHMCMCHLYTFFGEVPLIFFSLFSWKPCKLFENIVFRRPGKIIKMLLRTNILMWKTERTFLRSPVIVLGVTVYRPIVLTIGNRAQSRMWVRNKCSKTRKPL